MKRCIKTSETAFHSSWALGNSKGGRKPSVSEQLWSSSELSGSSDVITAHGDAYQPSAAVIMPIIIIIRGVHLVLLVDRRHGKQKDVSWGIQNKTKKKHHKRISHNICILQIWDNHGPEKIVLNVTFVDSS